MRAALVGLIVATAGIAGISAQPSAPKTVRVAVFGAEAPPLYLVAQHQGIFEKFGVRVVVEPRWASQELREGLAKGQFDIVHSAADNAVAVAEDLGVPVLVILGAGADSTPGTNLIVQDSIKTFADLRGTTILVDSPDTGQALALRKILRMKAGLEAGRDYKMLPMGQTRKRLDALKAGKEYAATMGPFNADARAAGLRSLGVAWELIGRYQVSSAYARRDWVRANSDATVGYLAGYLLAGRWSRDPANKAAVIAALAAKSDAESAARIYDSNFAGGPEPDPKFDADAFRNGLALRAEIQGTWGGKPPAPGRYLDFSYLEKALALLRSPAALEAQQQSAPSF